MSKKIAIPKKVKGYGYSGTWSDGTIGWMTSSYISGKQDRKYPSGPPEQYTKTVNGITDQLRFFLCEITVKPLRDKQGRPITKKF